MVFKQSEMVLEHLTLVTLTFDPCTPRSIRFLCYPWWIYGPSLRKVGQGLLQLLIGNSFGIFDNGDLDLWPSEPKSIRFLCYPGWMCRWSLRKVGQSVLELLIGNVFGTFDPGDFDLWPSDPKIRRVLLLPGAMCGPSLRKVDQRVLELLIRNEKVTDRSTDRPTCAKQYALSSLKFSFKY